MAKISQTKRITEEINLLSTYKNRRKILNMLEYLINILKELETGRFEACSLSKEFYIDNLAVKIIWHKLNKYKNEKDE